MKTRCALFGFCLITLTYLALLWWVDSRNQVFSHLSGLWRVFPVLFGLSLLSYLLRYARWHWLLRRAGNETGPVVGLLAYLSGFAFTATPAKVGELVRIRYLAPLGVPSWKVLAAFVYERAFDLMAVLLLASLAVARWDIFLLAMGFVVLLLGMIICVACRPVWLLKLSMRLKERKCRRAARMISILAEGLSGCRVWLTWPDALVSFSLGFLSWGLTALGFVYLLMQLGIPLPLLSAVALYPLAMLAGAASMLPGGVGSTEATIVLLLVLQGASAVTALLAAAGARISTLWFSMVCGFIALFALEMLSLRPSGECAEGGRVGGVSPARRFGRGDFGTDKAAAGFDAGASG